MTLWDKINGGEYKNTLPYNTRSERAEHREEDARIRDRFRADLFKDCGVESNPKKDQCFSLAWERGHSGGYSEIYNEFLDLVELIK